MASGWNVLGIVRLGVRAHDGNGLGALALDEARERHAREESVYRRVELFPQVMRHAAPVLLAVLAAAALRGIERLLDRADDVGDRELCGVAREVIAAAGTAHALDELAAAKLAEELLEIRERDLLPVADARERHRALPAVQGEVEHRGDCETPLGREPHGRSFGKPRRYPRNLLKYRI